MISPDYYNLKNTANVYLGGGLKHYMLKPLTKVLTTKESEMKDYETVYDKALEHFGEENQLYWTIIADCNKLKMPEDWRAGEKILLPVLILQDEVNRKTYERSSETTTTIPA